MRKSKEEPKEHITRFSDSSLETLPSQLFSAYVTREIDGERILLEEESFKYKIAKRYRFTKNNKCLELLLAFDGVVASRSFQDGKFYFRAGLVEGLRAIKLKTLLRVVILVNMQIDTFSTYVKPLLFGDSMKGLIDEIVLL